MALSKKEQIEKIQKIMSKKDNIPDYRFKYGKHEGRTFSYLLEFDRQYIIWCYTEEVYLPKRIIKYIEEEMI